MNYILGPNLYVNPLHQQVTDMGHQVSPVIKERKKLETININIRKYRLWPELHQRH